MSRARQALGFARTVGARLREENVPFMAGSIAYQAFVSLAPLLVLTLSYLSLFDGEQFGVAVTALLGALLAKSVAAAVVALAAPSYLGFVTPIVLVAGLCLAFFPMYWRFPDTDMTVRETVPGVVVAAVGWTLL